MQTQLNSRFPPGCLRRQSLTSASRTCSCSMKPPFGCPFLGSPLLHMKLRICKSKQESTMSI